MAQAQTDQGNAQGPLLGGAGRAGVSQQPHRFAAGRQGRLRLGQLGVAMGQQHQGFGQRGALSRIFRQQLAPHLHLHGIAGHGLRVAVEPPQ